MADSLRLELRPWKIAVVLVEPANTKTDMWDGALDMFDAGIAEMTDDERALYKRHIKGMRRTLGMMQKTAAPVDTVASTIETAVSARRPRARYVVGIAGEDPGDLGGAHATAAARLRAGEGDGDSAQGLRPCGRGPNPFRLPIQQHLRMAQKLRARNYPKSQFRTH